MLLQPLSGFYDECLLLCDGVEEPYQVVFEGLTFEINVIFNVYFAVEVGKSVLPIYWWDKGGDEVCEEFGVADDAGVDVHDVCAAEDSFNGVLSLAL